MIRLIILLGLYHINFCSFGQSVSCNCKGLIDYDYGGQIDIYDKPNGLVIKSIAEDFKNENLLTINIDKDSLNFFHATLIFCNTNESSIGWVKKAKYICTTAGDYSMPLILYSSNSVNSAIKYSIKDWEDERFEILKCSGDWVYIRVIKDGKIYEGWLDPKRQCNQPYTTCC